MLLLEFSSNISALHKSKQQDMRPTLSSNPRHVADTPMWVHLGATCQENQVSLCLPIVSDLFRN